MRGREIVNVCCLMLVLGTVVLWLVNDAHFLAPYFSMIKYGDVVDVEIL